jgi:hypothetical protein
VVSATDEQAAGGWWSTMIARRKQAHMPGVWVIYFSLAALPVFGLGQWFVDRDDLGGHRYLFKLMVFFVASAMAMLMTTNFLQLRRYLRQKRLPMPAPMAGMWLAWGIPLLIGLLLFSMFLPQPHPEYSISQLDAFSLSAESRRSSRVHVGREGTEDKDRQGQCINEQLERPPQGESGQTSSADAQAKTSGDDATADGKSDGDARAKSSSRQPSTESSESSGQSGDSDSSENERNSSERSSQPPDAEDGDADSQSPQRDATNTREQDQREQNRAKDAESKDTRPSPKTEEQDFRKDNGKTQPTNRPLPKSPPRFSVTTIADWAGAGLGGLIKLIY